MANPTEVWPSSSVVDALNNTTDSPTGLPYIARGASPQSSPSLAEQYQRRENRQNTVIRLANSLRVVKTGNDTLGGFEGYFRIGTTDYQYVGESSIAAWAAMTNGTWYVYATTTAGLGTLSVANAWPSDKSTFIPLAIVVRSAGVISTITDVRGYGIFWAQSSGGGASTGTDGVDFILDQDNVAGAEVQTQLRFRRGSAGPDAVLRHVAGTNKFQIVGNETSGVLTDLEARTLKADVATGTAPLDITSTTVVTNLNADRVDGIHLGAMPDTGAIVYVSAAGTISQGDVGSAGTLLVGQGAAKPLWKSLIDAGIQAVSDILTAISALATTGLIVRTGSGTVSTRTITGSGVVNITNGDGVSGNPTIAITGLTENSVIIGNSSGSIQNSAVGTDNTVLVGRTALTPTFRKIANADIDTAAAIDLSKISGYTNIPLVNASNTWTGIQIISGDTHFRFRNANSFIYSPSDGALNVFAATGLLALFGGTGVTISTDFGSITLEPVVKTTTAKPIESTLATGTAPLIITSTTVCTNLNADMVDGQHAASGTWTPTLTNVANVLASTAYLCHYARIGNEVVFSGRVDVNPTTTLTDTQLGISLPPIASNFVNSQDCGGTAVAPGIAGQCAALLADTANDRITMQWETTDVTNQAMYFHGSYRII